MTVAERADIEAARGRLIVALDLPTVTEASALCERIGDSVTRHAEVTSLEIDPVLFDAAFELKLPADVRKVY